MRELNSIKTHGRLIPLDALRFSFILCTFISLPLSDLSLLAVEGRAYQ